MKYSYVRGDLSGTFQRFGSYLALILRFAGYCIQDFQGFSKTNSMIKKLYTKDKKKGKKKDEKQEGLLNASGNDRELGGDKREDIIDEVGGRQEFSYKFSRHWCRTTPWLCLVRCCCCRESRDDRLFKTAKKKLSQELDILEIIRKLRVSNFTADVTLRPR